MSIPLCRYSRAPIFSTQNLIWLALIITLTCNLIIISRLYLPQQMHSLTTTTLPVLDFLPEEAVQQDNTVRNKGGDPSLTTDKRTPSTAKSPESLAETETAYRSVRQQTEHITDVQNIYRTITAGLKRSSEVSDVVIGQKSDLLTPGSEAEAVARKLMTVQKYRVVNAYEDFHFPINPKHICSNQTVEVLLCVISAVHNFPLRQQFRQAMKGNYAGIWNKANKAVLLFFLGLPNGPHSRHLQARVDNESLTNGDVVQASFVDTYRNLSLKSVTILKWVSSFCASSHFIIKTDDDCDVNIPLMMTELRKKQREMPLFILGKVSRKLKPIRSAKSKWYISSSLYKPDKYPTFMYGGSQGYPAAVAGLLYQASLRIPTFWLEDVYVSGLCAHVLNIPRFDNVAFYFSHFPPPNETEY